jgi:hypothetical protein
MPNFVAFQSACDALGIELQTEQGISSSDPCGASLSASLTTGLCALLRVPGVADVVDLAVRSAKYDLAKARLCTLLQAARRDVKHQLLLKEMSSLCLVHEHDSDRDVWITGSIEDLDDRGGSVCLRKYEEDELDPPVVARLLWHEDQTQTEDSNSFVLAADNFSGQGSVHRACWTTMFIDGRVNSGPLLSRLCLRLEGLIKAQQILDDTWRQYGVLVVWSKGRRAIVDSLDKKDQDIRSAAGTENNTLVDRLGCYLSECLLVRNLVSLTLCYLQFDVQ